MPAKITLHDKSWLATEREKELRDQRIEMGWPKHLAPFSTLVAAIGNHWHPGCREAVEAMCEFTANELGYHVTCYEEPDRCYQPYDALGIMRDKAFFRAINEGYEYLLYVDNDIMPPNDALVKLLHRLVPIISPLVLFADKLDHGLAMAKMKPNQGLAMVNDTVLSMLLFKTRVFFPWILTGFWANPLGADEGYHFEKLLMSGHQPFVDTDVVVTCVSPPHFPLDRILDRTAMDLEKSRWKE